MTVLSGLDAAGRRRSPATLPGYHAGWPPRNKGMRYPADPATVERSWRSRATRPMTVTAGACERRSSSCGAPVCASRKRSRSQSTTEDPSPRAAKSRPHASLKLAARVRERHSRTCPACPAYGALSDAAARASATYRCRQRATYRWRSQPSASSRVDPLALGAEDGERFGRAVDGPKPVRVRQENSAASPGSRTKSSSPSTSRSLPERT